MDKDREFWHTLGMSRCGGLGFRCLSIARSVGFSAFVCWLALTGSEALLRAQEIPASTDESIHTLHVYTNLVQIPTLVLDPGRQRIAVPIAEDRFSVSVDSGPWFRATHVRREGGDPISLAILLDMRFGADDFIPKLRDAMADLATSSLHERDHVSIYTLGCDLMRSANDVPADATQLAQGVDDGLKFWAIQKTVVCLQQDHLWDALAYIGGQLYQLPGRRVILAVSQGRDIGSKKTWNETRSYLQAAGVAVFGISHAIPEPKIHSQEVDQFGAMCESNGGLVFTTAMPMFSGTVKTFVTMVRDRYIVEFPRPTDATPGTHEMRIKIAKGDTDFIRAAGISMPIQDPAVLTDPTTVSAGPKDTPEIGSRKVLSKPQ